MKFVKIINLITYINDKFKILDKRQQSEQFWN